MAVKFKPKPGKPHISIYVDIYTCYLWYVNADDMCATNRIKLRNYCNRVNPLEAGYKTPGEAARALHYGSKS